MLPPYSPKFQPDRAFFLDLKGMVPAHVWTHSNHRRFGGYLVRLDPLEPQKIWRLPCPFGPTRTTEYLEIILSVWTHSNHRRFGGYLVRLDPLEPQKIWRLPCPFGPTRTTEDLEITLSGRLAAIALLESSSIAQNRQDSYDKINKYYSYSYTHTY